MKISVVIPAYNAVDTLGETLQSAVGQVVSVFDEDYPRGGVWPDGPALVERMCRALGHTGEPLLLGPHLNPDEHQLEILVIDDGSKDDTAVYARGLAAATPRGIEIRVIEKPNGGPASARNLGIAEATGDLVAFLDADDLWLPRKLARQIAALEAEPDAVMVYSDSLYFRKTGIYSPPGLKEDRRAAGNIFELLLVEGNIIPQLTVVARRDVLLEIAKDNGWDGPLDADPQVISSEDYGLWLDLAARGPVAYVPERLAWYRVMAGGLNLSRIAHSHAASRAVMRRAVNHPRAARIPRDRIRFRFAESWYEEGYEHMELGRPSEAARCFARSMATHPNVAAAKGLVRTGGNLIPILRPEPHSVADRGEDQVSFVE
jgi:glycosyltransferase involved in cell wall biosynthesis